MGENKMSFEMCLITTRHVLLEEQEKDIKSLCKQIESLPELPTDPLKLKQVLQKYDVVIGVLPLPLQVQVMQFKPFITFAMKSIGTFDTKEGAEGVASKYPGRTVILPPAREGEKYRVTIYLGLKAIKEIKIVEEWVVEHPIDG